MHPRRSTLLSVAHLLPLLLALGCAAGGKGAGAGGGSDSGGVDDSGGAADPAAADAAALQAAIDGSLDPAEALAQINRGGGLPIDMGEGRYRFACLCGPGAWQLAGDHDGWAGAPMTQAGALWWVEVAVPAPDGSRYKLHDADQGPDAGWMADPRARRYLYDELGEISLVQATAAHIERHLDVGGHGLAPREVRVWLPEGGAFTHAVYAHDGQNLFDPGAIWGGWRLNEALPPAVLVVGIDNTAERFAEYTPTTDQIDGQTLGGAADDYGLLIADLREDIEARYGEPRARALLGSSLGGLVSLHLGLADPAAWDMAISLSGTVGWGSIGADGPTLLDVVQAGGLSGPALFVDSGGGGPCVDSDGDGLEDDGPDARDNYCENRQLVDALAVAGWTWEEDLWHWHEPDAPHNEAAWAARVGRPLALFAGR